ncbi:MAG: hypothetical protein OEN01_04165 [Candidatus Krumholzibacteria bacterium]|nr:hypothetical protein [Candidatus Krumholzibacteria bacterium]
MNRLVTTYGLSALMAALTVLAACGTNGDDSTTPGTDNGVVASGEVTHIQNEIAVDGGITLDIDLVDDGSHRLIFPGLFTSPPPTDEDLRLYDVVRRVEIGDLVRAEGVRRDHGIILEKLWILDGQP